MMNIAHGSGPRADHAEATKTIDRDTAQFTGHGPGMVSAADFHNDLTAAGHPIWTRPNEGFPEGWQKPDNFSVGGNSKEIAKITDAPGRHVAAVLAQGAFAVLDVDRHDEDASKWGDPEALTASLTAAGIIVAARVASGGNGVHLYVPCSPRHTADRTDAFLAFPGVDFKTRGIVFLPGTRRAKHDHEPYRLEWSNLAGALEDPDEFMDSQEAFADWLDGHLKPSTTVERQPDQDAPLPEHPQEVAQVKRQVDVAVHEEVRRIAEAPEGNRDSTLVAQVFKLGRYAYLEDVNEGEIISREAVWSRVLEACESNGLAGDLGVNALRGKFDRQWDAGDREGCRAVPFDTVAGDFASVSAPDDWGHADRETRGQRRMAHRLAHAYRGRLLYVHGIGWHHWTGTHWAEDKDGTVKRAVDDILRRSHHESYGNKELIRDVLACQSGSATNGILDIARSLESMSTSVDQLDADPYLLNVANGALDLLTMELRPHRPEDRCTKIARGAYRPGSLGPDWQRLLKSSLPDEEVRGFLQRYVGQALIGRFTEKKLVLLKGEGDNGKSVWAQAIAHALGDYSISAQPDMLLVKKNQSAFDGTVELRGRRWAVISEVEQGRELAPATVKRLTGGDHIRARNLHEKNIEFAPSHTLAMLVNHLPHVTDKSEAMWERLRVVHWDVVIPREQRDPELAEKLEAEADAVLAWAVEGLREYQDRDGLDEPRQVHMATGAYRDDNDDIAQFFEECVEERPGQSVTPTALHDAYMAWGRAEKISGLLGRKKFGEEIRSVMHLDTGGRNRAWQGIALRQPEIAEDFSDDLI